MANEDENQPLPASLDDEPSTEEPVDLANVIEDEYSEEPVTE